MRNSNASNFFLPETDHVSLVASDAVHFPPWAMARQKLLNLETKKEHLDEEREGHCAWAGMYSKLGVPIIFIILLTS